MPYITEIRADAVFLAALQNFYTVCNANSATLELSAGQVTALNTALTTLTTKFNASNAAKEAAKAAVAAKNEQMDSAHDLVSEYAKLFDANLTVPDALLAQLMLPPHNPAGTSTPPAVPTELVATPNAEGFVTLRWNRNGNKPGTVFVVETRTSPTGNWGIVGVSTAVKFEFQAEHCEYLAMRVVARRAGMNSLPSSPVYLWADGGQEVFLQVA